MGLLGGQVSEILVALRHAHLETDFELSMAHPDMQILN